MIALTKTISAPIYTVTPKDVLVKCNCIANNIAITLPDATQNFGQEVTVQKIDTSSNTVTVEDKTLIDKGDYVTYTSNGTTWSLVDEYLTSKVRDYMVFNTEYDGNPTTAGTLFWDKQDGTLTVVINGGSVKLQIGQEMYIKAVNKTGVTITNGSVVYVNGAQGNRPTIALADADNYNDSLKVIGMVTADIANNAEGFVTTSGLVRDLNTSSLSAGDCVYLSQTAGSYAKASPPDGKARVVVGMVIKSHVTDGWICVRPKEITYMFGDPDAGNYSYYDANGVRVAKNSARLYEDLQFSTSSGKVPAVNFPSYETLTAGTRAYAFDVNEYLDLASNEPPHGTDFTSTANFHAHVTIKTANSTGASRYVKLQITCAYCAVDGEWVEFTATGEVEFPDGSPALHKKICTIDSATIDLSNVAIGGQISPVIKRISATGGTEYADSVFITQIGLHHLKDQDGSREVFSK